MSFSSKDLGGSWADLWGPCRSWGILGGSGKDLGGFWGGFGGSWGDLSIGSFKLHLG